MSKQTLLTDKTKLEEFSHYEIIPRFKGFQKSLKVNELKCKSYEDTINLIIHIFRDFFGGFHLDKFYLTHESMPTKIGDLWITTVFLWYKSKVIFSTSGKGTTLVQSVASGYGEFIERIQGLFFTSLYEKEYQLFYISRDEIPQNVLDQNDYYFKRIKMNNPFLPKYDLNDEDYIEYFNLFTNQTLPLHRRFMLSSNGYASGNTYEEALIQAICEFFERYSAIIVLLNNKKCSNITNDYLNAKNRAYIRKLKEEGITVLVKDLSLGKKLPVVGVVFNNKEYNIKTFKVASMTSLNLAVERCISEYFQSGYNQKYYLIEDINKFRMVKKLYGTFPYLNNYLPFKFYFVYNFPKKSFYPSKQLGFLIEDMGSFVEWNYLNKDCYLEFNSLLRLCKENEWEVYFRDWNWLGFPTVKVIIPNLYIGFGEWHHYIPEEINKFKKACLLDLSSLKDNDLEILEKPEFLIFILLCDKVSYFFNISTETLETVYTWEFFCLLAYAYNKNSIGKSYLRILKTLNYNRYLKCKTIIKNKETIIQHLQKLLPHCIESCMECRFQKECKTFIYEKTNYRDLLHKIK